MKFFEKKTGENESGTPQMQDMGLESGWRKFSSRRIIIRAIFTVALLLMVSSVIGFFIPSTPNQEVTNELIADNPDQDLPDQSVNSATETRVTPEASRMVPQQTTVAAVPDSPELSVQTTQSEPDSNSQAVAVTPEETKESITQTLEPSQQAPSESTPPATLPVPESNKDTTGTEATPPPAPVRPPPMAAVTSDRRLGIATTEAIIKVLQNELRGRWWGWRPNDLIQITDNVQNYQLGVLEVSRRAVVALAERMSRTGSTALYDPNLEMAMNWIMVKAESFWFPSAESKYKETVKDMQAYPYNAILKRRFIDIVHL